MLVKLKNLWFSMDSMMRALLMCIALYLMIYVVVDISEIVGREIVLWLM